MSHIDCCTFFETEITFVIVCFNDTDRVILSLDSWNVSMETHSICLILSVRNCATYSDTWLSASASWILRIKWLIHILCHKDHLLIHVEWYHSY